jgi:phage tail-like protein
VAVLGPPARYLWVAGAMFGDGEATLEVHQVRVEFERESWLRYLPPLYREDEAGRTFLERVLGLFESVEGDVSGLLDGLPRLLDAAGTPDDPRPDSWLDWLAGWVDARLDEAWPEERRRAMVAAAFELHALRGTPEGLRRLAELALDAPITVREPGAEAKLWTLGEGSTLGFGTMLVPAEAEGAVVGSTAIVDGSHLIEERDFGAPLFDDLAHRFCVQAYGADLARPGTAEALSALLDREKPAHTEYHLCVVDARFRVGFQARIGVDSIVAGDPGPFVLGGDGELGFDSRVGGGRPATVLDRDDRIGVLASMT